MHAAMHFNLVLEAGGGPGVPDTCHFQGAACGLDAVGKSRPVSLAVEH
jgi:hypothetical protein